MYVTINGNMIDFCELEMEILCTLMYSNVNILLVIL